MPSWRSRATPAFPKRICGPLGVIVRGVRLLSEFPKYMGVDLAGGHIPGIVDSGFHAQEIHDGKPCRWTNGSAKLTVPLRGETPRARWALLAWIPDIPKYRVRVAVNGKARSSTMRSKRTASGPLTCR